MNLIEFFIDTKHKRVVLLALIFTILLLKEAICNIFFVIPILSFSSLESLYSLIPYAEYSFIGRLLYSLYNITSINIPHILLTICKCFSLSMIISIIFTFYYLSVNYKDFIFKLTKRMSILTLFFIVLIYFGALVVIVKNVTILTTYYTVLNAVHIVALWLLVTHGLYVVFLLCFLYFIIKEYVEALEYRAIEVNELRNE